MSAGCAVAALTLAATGLVASCAGNSRDTIKIGVIFDCQGPFAPFYEQTVAGAEMPFITRGARLRGNGPSDGVGKIVIGGKSVEFVPGCERYGTPTTTLAEARRLVEQEGADAIVAPFWGGDGLLVRQYARVRPGIVFSAASFEPPVTLDRPPPNVFRFNVDSAQSIAGLGAYAYHRLGWRRVVTFGQDDPSGWPLVAGFVAEFCSLGGNIVKRLWSGPVVSDRDWRHVVARIPRAGVDGVLFASELQDPAGFFAAYGARHPHLARRVVVSGLTLAHTSRLSPPLVGVVGSYQNPFGETVATWNRYADEFRSAFVGHDLSASTSAAPGRFAPPGLADTYYYNATEALLQALARVQGDISHGERRLMAALRALSLERPNGSARVDADGQAVAPAFLSRVQRGADGALTVQTFRAVTSVEHTFNGYFSRDRPASSKTQPRCRHGNPPSWTASG